MTEQSQNPAGRPHRLLINGVPQDLHFPEATPETIGAAVSAAAAAFLPYRKVPAPRRAAFLDAIADGIHSAKEELVDVAMQETHLPEARLLGEVQRTVNQLKAFAGLLREGSWVRAVIDTALPDRKPLPRPDLRQLQLPIGPVAVFGASNFPFAFSVAGGDTAAALAAGCPVIYKVHPGHPATSERTAEFVRAAAAGCGMPEGVFALLHGTGHEVGGRLVEHPLLKAVAFTGSLAGGRALFDRAARRAEPIPVYAEMGSVNPVFLLPDMVRQQSGALAEKLAASNLLGTGQFCTNPGIIGSIRSEGASEFARQFAAQIERACGACMLTEGIFEGYRRGADHLAAQPGVTLAAKGTAGDAPHAPVPYMYTAPVTAVLGNSGLLEEVFGPSSLHLTAANGDELMALARSLPGQLTVSIWATEKDLEEYAGLVEVLEEKAGRLLFNSVPTGVEVAPAMVHGGPYPATTDSRSTSVGASAIYRFTRPVCFQDAPPSLLAPELQDGNPLGIWRQVNGAFTQDPINPEP
ncbi:MAG TPA: aldehyde dehydrogenase (NADP(+)) [Chitinophagaceae bacterium]|nr:aldehyde dehydrogenase (NADP(+)) [Chitinophagaceae bacterium]